MLGEMDVAPVTRPQCKRQPSGAPRDWDAPMKPAAVTNSGGGEGLESATHQAGAHTGFSNGGYDFRGGPPMPMGT